MDIVSRKEMLARGLPRYFTGKPCKHGHIAERNSAGVCIVCRDKFAADIFAKRYRNDPEFVASRKAKVQEWRRANPDKIAAMNRRFYQRYPEKSKADRQAWAAKNPDKVRLYSREKRKRNPETYREAVRQWAIRNPERAKDVARARAHNRRSRELENGGHATADDVKKIRLAQNGRCAGCLKKAKKMHLDHIIALARGGTNDPSNLQFLCVPCNQSKGARDHIEWANANGRLC